ncbi:MAG: RNA methyltransferase [Verrucomicrobiota bacterium]
MEDDPDWVEQLRVQIRGRKDPWVVLEGRHAVEAAVAGWWDLAGILATEGSGWEPPEWSGLEVLRKPSDYLDAVAGYRFHRGVLGLAKLPDETEDVAGLMAEVEADALVVICPRLADASNAGAIIRNAAALGAKAVIFGKEGVSPFERKSVRASSGALFRIPVRVADGGQILRCLKTAGFQMIGAAVGEGTRRIDRAEIEPGRVAVIVGSEEEGLGSFWEAACDELTHLPMDSGMDSLNAAAASAIFLWEIRRRRQESVERPD